MHRITINVPSALAVEFNSNIVIKLENETVSRVFKRTKKIFVEILATWSVLEATT